MGKRGSTNAVDSVNGSADAWAYRSMRISRGSELTNAIKLRQSTRTAPVGENRSFVDDSSTNPGQSSWMNVGLCRGTQCRTVLTFTPPTF